MLRALEGRLVSLISPKGRRLRQGSCWEARKKSVSSIGVFFTHMVLPDNGLPLVQENYHSTKPPNFVPDDIVLFPLAGGLSFF